MTKKDFINNYAETIKNVTDLKITKKDLTVLTDAFIDTLETVVASGDKLSFTGFGTFETSEIEARDGRNPLTGEAITIAAHKRIKFKPAKAFKDLVNEK